MRKLTSRLSLLTQFTITSLLITAAIALLLAYVLREKLVQDALEQVASTAAEQADRIIEPQLHPEDLAGLTPESYAALDARIKSEVIGQHIVRVKIWDRQGGLIYSDDKDLVGKTYPLSDELEEALAGKLAMDVSALTKPENDSESGLRGQPFFEIYVPIRLQSSSVLGAFEIYHDLDVVQARVAEVSALVYRSVALGFITLYLSLYVLVRRASAELLRRGAENARLFEQEQARRAELAALYDLSRVLSITDEFDVLLEAVVSRAVETVGVSSARLAVLQSDELVVRAAHPVRILDHDLQLGHREPLAALPFVSRLLKQDDPVVLTRQSADLSDRERNFLLLDHAQTLCLVPLRVSDHDLGVLMLAEMRNPTREPFDGDKLTFAQSIGEQAASALHRASLHEQTVLDGLELTAAYEATIEGWSRALDLRDHETEGHTRRVTEMTEYLAREMGVREAELVHIRRGALLHDIGKMGIPDKVLLKPGTLSADDWAIMRKHPEYAFQVLSPIAYLRPALDIPYCHHEKWDGTGYPRRLKGEAIPFAARIFAIVDIWDALCSDRPYRRAWNEPDVLKHIRSLSGTHLDPRVVQTFFQIPAEERQRVRVRVNGSAGQPLFPLIPYKPQPQLDVIAPHPSLLR